MAFGSTLLSAARLPVAAVFAGVVALGAFAGSVSAQPYPSKPITIVAPFPPGGGVDIFSRVLGEKLAQRLRQPVVVTNKPGANTIIGTELVARAEPDGHTLLVTISGFTINPSLYKQATYDPVKDFTPITQMSTVPLLLVVNRDLPVRNVDELIAFARSNSGKLNYASIGNGSSTHLAAELFKTMTGVDIVHVPYKGASPAMADIIAGQAQMIFIDNLVAAPLVADGRVRAIGITSPTPSPLAPELRLVAESVPGFSVVGWIGLFAPAGTPPDVVQKLHDEARAILPLPDVREKLARMGPVPESSTPAEFAALVRSEVAKWAEVVRKSGARVD